MKLQNLKKYIYSFIFNPKREDVFVLSLALFISLSAAFIIYNIEEKKHPSVPEELKVNLNIMIPQGFVLYPFDTDNFQQIEPLLEAYNMVKVYNPQTGHLLAENIKVLRAPKDPSQLAFLLPVNIAKVFASFGLNFNIMIQKYQNGKKAKLYEKNNFSNPKKYGTFITFGD